MHARSRWSAVFAALWFVALPSFAAETAPKPAARPAFGLEHALTLRQVQAPVWSRDGKRIAFTVQAPDTAENTTNQDIWLWDAASNTSRALTRHAKNDYAPQFSPGGDTVAFLSARDSEEGKPSIYLLPLRGGEPWKLTTLNESVGEFRWSPDGKSIAFTLLDTLSKQAKDWRKKKWDHVVEDEIPQFNHLWVLDLASGQPRRITQGAFMVASPKWSPDSKSIAFVWNPTGAMDHGNESDIAIVPAAGGTLRKVGALPENGYAWSPDGKWLAWAGTSDRTKHVDKALLWVAPAVGG